MVTPILQMKELRLREIDHLLKVQLFASTRQNVKVTFELKSVWLQSLKSYRQDRAASP